MLEILALNFVFLGISFENGLYPGVLLFRDGMGERALNRLILVRNSGLQLRIRSSC